MCTFMSIFRLSVLATQVALKDNRKSLLMILEAEKSYDQVATVIWCLVGTWFIHCFQVVSLQGRKGKAFL